MPRDRRPRLGAVLTGVAALVAATAGAPEAHAVIVEKIVAVVGDRALLMTDLHTRARPFLTQLQARCPIGTPQCIPAENKIYQQLLERIVDEELEAQAAKRASIVVTAKDVDATLERIAQMNRMTQADLFADISRQSGMTDAEYRQEIRQQIVEGKLMQRIVQSQIRVTRQDVEAMFARLVERERHVLLYQAAWIVLPIAASGTAAAVDAKRREAAALVQLARNGSEFAALAREHSEDAKTREDGGDLGLRAPTGSPAALSGQQKLLAEPLEKVALGLGLGQVSEPFRFKDAIVIMRLSNRQPSRYSSFEAAQDELSQRVQTEKLEKAKQKWLKDLRRRTHVDVRFL